MITYSYGSMAQVNCILSWQYKKLKSNWARNYFLKFTNNRNIDT